MAFYLTLPSNSSMDYYPDNHAANFKTKLAHEFRLDDGAWEVGLSEIHFTNNYQTVNDNSIWMTYSTPDYETQKTKEFLASKMKPGTSGAYVFKPPKTHEIALAAGLFASNEEFIRQLNVRIEKFFRHELREEDVPLEVEYNSARKRATVAVKEIGGTVRLSRMLENIFGFEQESVFRGRSQVESGKSMDIYQNFKSIFVYCDLAAARPVGDSVSPLLRTLAINNQRTEVFHQIFNKPHYIPLSRNAFDSVEILLSTDTGETLSFSSGHAIVTLHFRKRKLE